MKAKKAKTLRMKAKTTKSYLWKQKSTLSNFSLNKKNYSEQV